MEVHLREFSGDTVGFLNLAFFDRKAERPPDVGMKNAARGAGINHCFKRWRRRGMLPGKACKGYTENEAQEGGVLSITVSSSKCAAFSDNSSKVFATARTVLSSSERRIQQSDGADFSAFTRGVSIFASMIQPPECLMRESTPEITFSSRPEPLASLKNRTSVTARAFC